MKNVTEDKMVWKETKNLWKKKEKTLKEKKEKIKNDMRGEKKKEKEWMNELRERIFF